MYAFFGIVERAGIGQRHLSDLMGIHESKFSHVKTGRREPDHAFMAAAKSALKMIGIRQEDGTPYTVDALFFEDVDNMLSISVNPLDMERVAD